MTSSDASLIEQEQLRTLYARCLSIAIVNAAFSSPAIAFGLWGVATAAQLAGWIAINLSLSCVFTALHCHQRRNPSLLSGAYLVISLLCLSLYWSAILGYLFVSTRGELYHLYLYVYWGGMLALTVGVLAEHLPTFYAFVVPASTLLTALAIREGEAGYDALAALTALCVGAVAMLAHSKCKAFKTATQLRFEMRALAEEATRQREIAEQANIAKSKFLAAASHDMRQPLHALALLADALQAVRNDDEARNIALDIGAAVRSLDKLFNGLLDVSRLDAGVMTPQRVHFKLDTLLQRLANESALAARGKGLSLGFVPSGFTVFSDPVMLESILRNFISNAIRYTAEGSVRISADAHGDSIRIEVQDTGIGIAPECHEAIFSEFYQLDNPERDRARGFGLGLAIVRRIAKLLDHEIGVHSELGRGACFHIDVTRGETRLEQNEPSAPPTTLDVSGLRVLVIDDDAAIRSSVSTLLRLWGCDCVTAESEDEAVLRLRELGPADAVIVDYRLRAERTGLQAIARLHAEFQRMIPALLVSGDTAPERLRDAAASGHMLVHKPAPPHVIRVFLGNVRRTLRA